MFNFLKKINKNKSNEDNDILTKTASLLIHAAKIDQNYSNPKSRPVRKLCVRKGQLAYPTVLGPKFLARS